MFELLGQLEVSNPELVRQMLESSPGRDEFYEELSVMCDVEVGDQAEVKSLVKDFGLR